MGKIRINKKQHQKKIQLLYKELAKEIENNDIHKVLTKLEVNYDEEKLNEAIYAIKTNLNRQGALMKQAQLLYDPKKVFEFINSNGDKIRVQVQKYLDDVERLSKMEDDDAIEISMAIIGISAAAVGVIAGITVFVQLIRGVGYLTFSIVLAGVLSAGAAIVVAIAAFIVLMLIFPFLYFMNKPAVCIVALINELPGLDFDSDLTGLKNTLTFSDNYNIHGKPTLITKEIPGALFTDQGPYAYIGLFATSKRDKALIGPQYGFTLELPYSKDLHKDEVKSMTAAFGAGCPLALGKNNCYCDFDISAEKAAKNANKHSNQTWYAENDGVSLSIKCNSGSGSIAYYIARVYKTKHSINN
ncbi:hypothetical protein PsW64_03768 [Pseudovibrio sp. W64]|uniref:hypothetical protein n=1 Tax=Pseudovibrio sp. W64 TaxID=1735583 RepID=UPI0007AE93C3|nr:hypothetical protein [Pseudovibrio sp. W64]KZK78130.1 hypothetical protein PsW64_03768 [Pseudovibrio sp. W64]